MENQEGLISKIEKNEGAKCAIELVNGDKWIVIIGKLKFETKKYVLGINLLDDGGRGIIIPINEIISLEIIK